MKRSTIATLIAIATLGACAQLKQMTGGGWTTLIDGDKGLENWNQVGAANWHVENDAIVADHGKPGFLVSKQPYGDFEIRAEFWAATDTNSGVFIRCSNPKEIAGATCYEVNIWDIRPEPKYGTGAIVDVAAVPVPITNKAGGQWNTYEIIAKGQQLTVRLNGVQTANVQDSKHASGYFALQYGPGVKGAESGPIKWRKVQIRPL
jgi:hypothetical protein